MEALKSSRKQYRRLFTMACNDFDKEEPNLTNEDKISKLRVLENKAKIMIVNENKVREILFAEDTEETVLSKEIDESELYFDKWRILENKLNALVSSSSKVQSVNTDVHNVNFNVQNATTPSDMSFNQNKLINYPKIKLPTFDGNVKNWLGFWGQFQKIDKETSLDDCDKFAYLAQAMEKNTPADDLIRSFPPIGESYRSALKLLQTRFGNEELLIEIYVRDLLSLVIQKQSSGSLRKLYDQLESKLRSLETLGVSREKYGAILYPLVESSLPNETLRAWERLRFARRRSQITEGEESSDSQVFSPYKSDLDRLLYFLRDEVQSEERICLASKGFVVSTDPNRPVRNNKRDIFNPRIKESYSAPSAAELFATSQNSQRSCIFCVTTANHNSWDCRKARNLSLKERQDIVGKARCCFLCLRTGHSFKKCRIKTTCFICDKKHHTLLCRNLAPIGTFEKKETETVIGQDEALGNFSRSPNVLLQTIKVVIRGKNVKRTVRAIIDSGSQRSYILQSTAKEMGYEHTRKEYLRHSLFGGANTDVCEHKVYTIYLSSVSESYNCHFEALSQTVICNSMPPVTQGAWLKELDSWKIDLSDRHEGPIEILIGADVSGKLLTGNLKQSSCGLVAVQTKLGWTVMGKLHNSDDHGSTVLSVTSMLTKDSLISDLWTLDSLGILDPSEKKTKQELHEAAREHFLSTPADLPSRGCSTKHLYKSKWWEDPSWLLEPPENWPNAESTTNEEEVISEKVKKIVSSLISTEMLSEISTKFSNHRKAVKVVSWMQRFAFNCKNKQKKRGELTVEELNIAEESIIRLIQTESFQGVDDKRLQSLNPFYDNGILRAKTGAFRRDDTTGFRTPIILPSEHPLVKNLIMEEHKRKGHAGDSYVLNSLRERFWVLCGRRIVRAVLRTCVICKRHSAKCFTPPSAPPSAPPPGKRVEDAAVFQVTGVDFAGPLMLRTKEKAWICLFTCAVYRAVHLELVTSLSTEAFLQAFHRFVSRRGKPTTVYSDNGTNFVGTANALESIDFAEISRRGVEESITWKFIPPGAPWWGGWWERLIGIMKQVLRKVLRQSCLNYEEMLTVLCDCEAILNDRPLTVVPADPDYKALRPADFLKEIRNDRVPDIKLRKNPSYFQRRLQYIQSVRESFRKRFRKEYLGILKISHKRASKKSVIKTGDIVLVGGNDKKRLIWPLGRVVKLFPGTDGTIRLAKIQTQNGELLRALQSLYPLEVASEEDEKTEKLLVIPEDDITLNPIKLVDSVDKEQCKQMTRYGRKVIPPKRLSY